MHYRVVVPGQIVVFVIVNKFVTIYENGNSIDVHVHVTTSVVF